MISIICSNYNSSIWINDYLASLNAQLLPYFNVVFVDANSTDDSLMTIERFPFRAGIMAQIIKSKERISVYEAWNLAIQSCSTDYIVNYNTDDYLLPSALLVYNGYAAAYPEVDLFYGANFVHDDPKTKEATTVRIWPSYNHEILKRVCICGPFPCVKKSVIEKVGYFNPKYKSSSDYDMWLKLSYRGFKFLNIREVIGSFYYRDDSISNKNLASAQAEDEEIQLKY